MTADPAVADRDARLAQSLITLATSLLRSDDAAAEAEAVEEDAPKAANSRETKNVGTRLTLTVEEAARLLGVSRAHAYELAARGEIPILRLGRRVLVPREALVRMMSR
jgi:excisionase family DNA binding protein